MNYQQPQYQPQNNQQTQPQYQQPGQPPQQQPAAQPFTGGFEISDSAPIVADGSHHVRLARLEMYQGTKWNTQPPLPEDKLRFVFTVLSGAEAGKEIWNIENVPDKLPSGKRKPLSTKSGIFKVIGQLLGRDYAAGEPLESCVGIEGWAEVRGGKFQHFMRMPESAPQQQPVPMQPQPLVGPRHSSVQQHVQPAAVQPQYDAYAEPVPQTPPPEHAETQQQAVERI